jgi:hypothetical protein
LQYKEQKIFKYKESLRGLEHYYTCQYIFVIIYRMALLEEEDRVNEAGEKMPKEVM